MLLSGAVGAMSGPLHGGAPARVIPMIEEAERTGDPRAVVSDGARLWIANTDAHELVRIELATREATVLPMTS